MSMKLSSLMALSTARNGGGIFHSFLVIFYSSLVIFYSLLVAFLLVTHLIFTRYSLRFHSLLNAFLLG